MTSPQPLEILDLRHFSARQLRPLLDQAAAGWLRRLRWDYRNSTELLLQYLDSRILPGYVAMQRGRVCGYTFYVYEGPKAVVGDLYASHDSISPLNVTFTLASHLLTTLRASPDVDRIEAQLLLYDAGTLPPLFPEFTVYPRLFLESTLDPPPIPAAIPADFELCPWAPAFYQPTAELIRAAYVGHIDSEINDQYRTLHGSLRFLHNVVRFPGCGVFDPGCSWVLRDRATNSIIAALLCSRVTPETLPGGDGPTGPVAHVTQLCVAPAFRGRRLGKLLLEVCMARLPLNRYRALTLTVSEANHAALHLYLAAGFAIRHRFDALVLNKDQQHPPATLTNMLSS